MFEANKQKSAHFEIFLSTVHYDSLSFPQWFGRRSQTKDPHFIIWLMQAKLWWVSLANILTKVTSFVKQQWITKCLSSLGQTISCVLSEEEPNHRQQEELKQQPWLYWAF